jgi:hypothetical protein
MSNIFYSPNHNNYNNILLPRINSKKIFHNNKDTFRTINNNNKNPIYNSNKIIENNPLEKKPGTSIDKRKPQYILPKIPIKKLSNTANVKADDSKKINNNFYCKEFVCQNNENNNNDIHIMDNNYYEQYGKNAIDLLNNDDELKNMFNEIYDGKNDEKYKKEWIEKHLFGREVFVVMLESYIRQNKDIKTFIKNEINKILNNKLLDNIVIKSFKQINFQYDDYINKIYNM